MTTPKESRTAYFYDGTLGKIVEIRASEDGKETGIVEAYLTQWDTVDSWNTSFKKGSFAATIQKRGVQGIRLIWNHEELAGKVLDLREDAYGPKATVQFNLETRAGREAFAHVKAGDVTCFSFGFITVSDGWKGSVREIKEIELFECGPVVFEANSNAKVMSVRSGAVEAIGYNKLERITGVLEQRAEEFNQTQMERELSSKGWQLIDSLEYTIEDIYWGDSATSAEVIEKVDTCIAQFHLAYISWLNEYYAQFEQRQGKPPLETRNKLRLAMAQQDILTLARRTSFTEDELTALKNGQLLPIEARSKLKELSPEVQQAFDETRSACIEQLCSEIRASNLTRGEFDRISALLASNTPIEHRAAEVMFDVLKTFRETLKTKE